MKYVFVDFKNAIKLTFFPFLFRLQVASSKKGKAAEKSPPSTPCSSGAADLNNQIVAQGDIVRKLKGDKASKVGILLDFMPLFSFNDNELLTIMILDRYKTIRKLII